MALRLHARALVAGLALACGPRDLPSSARPTGDGVSPGWPDVAAPAEPRRPRAWQDAALVVSVEDYQTLADRPGAHAIAGAWIRHLHDQRGLRWSRIRWLRDAEVEPKKIIRALEDVHWHVGRNARLWVIFVGHAGSSDEAPLGLLLGPAATGGVDDVATAAPLLAVLAWAGHGLHRDLVAVVDGCVPATAEPMPLRSGVPAPSLPSLDQWLLPPGPRVYCGLLGEAEAQVIAAFKRTIAALRREPTNTVVFTAGQGERCREALPGADTPALSYLLLGALRGWGDGDGDGLVTSSEAMRGVEAILGSLPITAPPIPRFEARGSDMILAEVAGEPGPRIADLAGRVTAQEAAAGDSQAIVAEAAFLADEAIRIDRGFFKLGCHRRRDPRCEDDERPPTRIFLDAFAIDRHEVTWGEYEACVAADACDPIDVATCEVWTGDGFERGAPLPASFRGHRRPVVCATWEQGRSYCAHLGKRLPTEAEWERAARGSGRRALYPWGDDPATCQRANIHGCGDATTDVGTHPAGRSPEGVHDLAGNVAEWVADWYHKRSYRHIPRHNPAGADEGRVRVVRGGSFYENPEYVRASYRYGLSPQWGFGFVGFRCAR